MALEAIAAARCPLALIILDLGLPKLAGEAFAQEVRRFRGEDVPILVPSAAPPDELASTARRIQARSWIRKPFDIGDMEARIRALVVSSSAYGAKRQRERAHWPKCGQRSPAGRRCWRCALPARRSQASRSAGHVRLADSQPRADIGRAHVGFGAVQKGQYVEPHPRQLGDGQLIVQHGVQRSKRPYEG
ncbi:MAG: response regulator [Chloroflexota bacterium]